MHNDCGSHTLLMGLQENIAVLQSQELNGIEQQGKRAAGKAKKTKGPPRRVLQENLQSPEI